MVQLREILVICILFAAFLNFTHALSSKIDPNLVDSLQTKRLANIIVKFKDGTQDVIRQAKLLRSGTRTQRINHLVYNLKNISQSSQQYALNLLQSRSPHSAHSHKQIWATNELYIKGANLFLINQLANLPEVSQLREERIFPLDHLQHFHAPQMENKKEGESRPDWHLEIVEVPQVWEMSGGNSGQGVVVANIDSGVRHTHEALRNNFRQHYGWFDPSSDSLVPIDASGHGTHTMGTLAGSHGIGVAPEAQWIACKGCHSSCPESALLACGQWVLCPTLPNGTNPDCSMAPRIVSNSWGSLGNDNFYSEIISAWQAANIIPLFAIGNYGPECGTLTVPGRSTKDVIGVGATTPEDNIWAGSSAGDATDPEAVKPDISAPGHSVRSAWVANDTAYYTSSGTSIATPIVAGVATLLISKNPELSYTQVKQILESSAEREGLMDTGRICGGIPSTHFPNNQYGHGRVNALRAILSAEKV